MLQTVAVSASRLALAPTKADSMQRAPTTATVVVAQGIDTALMVSAAATTVNKERARVPAIGPAETAAAPEEGPTVPLLLVAEHHPRQGKNGKSIQRRVR